MHFARTQSFAMRIRPLAQQLDVRELPRTASRVSGRQGKAALGIWEVAVLRAGLIEGSRRDQEKSGGCG